MKIWIRNRQKLIPLDLREVRRAVRAILADLALPEAELSILFVDDAEIQELNQRHLRRDKPTNVIAFPMREGDRNVPREPRLVGGVKGHNMKRNYLTGKPRPEAGELQFPGPHPNLLGDVVISVETAQRQSSRFGLNEMEMILFLTIHGILHLLGYDHEKGAREARRMTKKQKELLRSVLSSA
jgi:probable rRNA maturation factor